MFRAAKHLADDKAPIVSANLIATISLYCKCVLKEKMMDLFAQLCECLARYSENVSLMRPSSDAQLCVASLGYLTHSVCVITALGEGAIPKVSVDALERSLAASVYSIRPSFSANSSLFDKSSKKVTDLYDGYLRWHQSLTELRWLVSKQLSAVCSRDNRSNPLISNKCYEYLEELLTVHGKIVAAGLDADSASQKSATDSKWAPARSNCWESLCYAGVMSMEGSRTASVETLLSYADRAVEQVTTKADSYQGQVQGLSFVANFLCVTPLPRASVRSLTYGFAEDFTTRVFTCTKKRRRRKAHFFMVPFALYLRGRVDCSRELPRLQHRTDSTSWTKTKYQIGTRLYRGASSCLRIRRHVYFLYSKFHCRVRFCPVSSVGRAVAS